MVGKSSVSALQEYCAKHQIALPTYDFITSSESGYICEVVVLIDGEMEMKAHGSGRSKRDAKHLAASNMVKKLRQVYPDIDEMPALVHTGEIPATDMIMTLRDYCVQHHHPLPTFEVVQRGGTPDAPEFTVLCALTSIRRYGVSDKKKDARQKAAWEMLRVIMNENDKMENYMQVATVDAANEDIEAERYKKFKTYHELTESKIDDMPGVLLCDRHNYFSNFFEELKQAAYKVLVTPYETEKEKAMDVFKALKITPKITKMPAMTTTEPMVFIELNCDYDAVFADLESRVYTSVLSYFTNML